MPKNKGKGGKGKRRGKRSAGQDEKRDLRYKTTGECYARASKILGNCRLECYCYDGKTRLGKIRGKFKKRVWINKDDIILVSLRDYQDERCDVVYKYNQEEVRLLRRWGEIPPETKGDSDDDDDDDDFDDFDEFADIIADDIPEQPYDPYEGLEEFDSSYDDSEENSEEDGEEG